MYTTFGQERDDLAVLERFAAGERRVTRAKEILDTIRLQSLVVAVIALVAMGLWRKRPRVSLGVVLVFAGTILLAELLKWVLPRSELTELEDQVKFGGLNTFPSGHATIATSLVLAFLLLSTARARPWVAMVGVIWAATATWGTLAAGWHRPSDSIGGILLATACFAGAAAWLLPRYWRSVTPTPLSGKVLPMGALALVLVAVSTRVISWWSPPGDDWSLDSIEYVSASLLILIAVGASILGFTTLLRSVDLD